LEHSGTAGADTAELMTGRRPPGRKSTRVGFAVLATAFVLEMLLHIAVGAAVWYVMGRSPGRCRAARLNETMSLLTQTAVNVQ
jgi:hypothetical protein